MPDITPSHYSLNIKTTNKCYRKFVMGGATTIGVLANETYEINFENHTDQNVKVKFAVNGLYLHNDFIPVSSKNKIIYGGLKYSTSLGTIQAEVYVEGVNYGITQPITFNWPTWSEQLYYTNIPITTQTYTTNTTATTSTYAATSTYIPTTNTATDYTQTATQTTNNATIPFQFTFSADSWPIETLVVNYVAWEEIVKRVQLNEDLSLLKDLPPNTHITAGRFV